MQVLTPLFFVCTGGLFFVCTGAPNRNAQGKRKVSPARPAQDRGASPAEQADKLLVAGKAAGLRAQNDTRPNILVLLADDFARAGISAYSEPYGGHAAPLLQTPNIDRLAAEGMRFRNSFVTNSLCAPSRAVILTGDPTGKVTSRRLSRRTLCWPSRVAMSVPLTASPSLESLGPGRSSRSQPASAGLLRRR